MFDLDSLLQTEHPELGVFTIKVRRKQSTSLYTVVIVGQCFRGCVRKIESTTACRHHLRLLPPADSMSHTHKLRSQELRRFQTCCTCAGPQIRQSSSDICSTNYLGLAQDTVTAVSSSSFLLCGHRTYQWTSSKKKWKCCFSEPSTRCAFALGEFARYK